MFKIVIISKNPNLEIGKIYRGLAADPWTEPRPNQYQRVLAKSDAQAWIDCLASIRGEHLRDHFETLTIFGGPWYYYEIQTD